MSRIKTRIFKEVLQREIQNWNGVKYRFDNRNHHPCIIVSYRGKEQFIPFPKSGSDRRGPLNNRAQLRQRLKKMGAERNDNSTR
jgi:hypothetical protein